MICYRFHCRTCSDGRQTDSAAEPTLYTEGCELLTLAHPYHQYQFLYVVVQQKASHNDLYGVVSGRRCRWPNAIEHRLLKMIQTLYKTFILLIIVIDTFVY